MGEYGTERRVEKRHLIHSRETRSYCGSQSLRISIMKYFYPTGEIERNVKERKELGNVLAKDDQQKQKWDGQMIKFH